MSVVGNFPPAASGTAAVAQHALGVTLLIAGVTLLSRWPRIAKGPRWWIVGATAFQMGCVGFVALIPSPSRHAIGRVFAEHSSLLTWMEVVLTIAVSFVTLCIVRNYTQGTKRRLSQGKTVNLGNGIFASLAIVVGLVLGAQFFNLGPMEQFLSAKHTAFFVTYGLLVTALTMPWWKHDAKNPKTKGKSGARIGVVAGAIAAFLTGSALYVFGPAVLKAPVENFFANWGEPATTGILGMALVVALVGLMALVKPMTPSRKDSEHPIKKLAKAVATKCNLNASRRTRWFSKRMRPLIFSGAAGIAGLILFQIFHAPQTLSDEQRSDIREKYILWKSNEVARAKLQPSIDVGQFASEATERVNSIENMVSLRPPVWPLAVAGVAFLYLWWLSALIFDLGFVWQYYVRRSVANQRLFQWCKRSFADSTD